MSKLPRSEGDAYGRWYNGCPTCRNTGPSNRATRLTRGAFFFSRAETALKNPEQSPAEVKRALRTELIAVRARLSQEDRLARSRAVADRLEAVEAFRSATTVALYSPLGTEVDSLPIARRALSRGARVVFPRVVRGERRLAFSRCDPSDLAPGPLGAAEPPAGAPEVPPGEIGCVVMPGVAFSLEGRRLGRGGGYYDATLRRMPGAVRIGVAYDVQIVPTLPHEAHDQTLDALVTDARTLQFARDSR